MTFIQIQSRNASLHLRKDAITAVLEVKDPQLPFRTQVQVGQSTYMVTDTFEEVMSKITGESPVTNNVVVSYPKKKAASTKKPTTKKRR